MKQRTVVGQEQELRLGRGALQQRIQGGRLPPHGPATGVAPIVAHHQQRPPLLHQAAAAAALGRRRSGRAGAALVGRGGAAHAQRAI